MGTGAGRSHTSAVLHETDAMRAWGALVVVHRLTSRAAYAALAKVGLSPSQFTVMGVLLGYTTDASMRFGDLVSQLAPLSQPTVSRLVQSMERSGLLAREVAPDDRRGVIVQLTPAGRRAFLRARRVADVAVDERFGRFLETGEARALADVLERVIARASVH